MVLKNSLLGACFLCLAVLPVHAAIYDVDLLLDDYTWESVDGTWVSTHAYDDVDGRRVRVGGADPVSIIGQIETDGTTGVLDASNILSWSFTVSSTTGTQDFSSEGLFGWTTAAYGTFEATETSFFGGEGRWGFIEMINAPTAYVIGRLYGENGSLNTFAYFQDLDRDCSSGNCQITNNQGNLGSERDLRLLGTSSVVTTRVVTNPVPASLPLILSGFGILGFLGWRRRRQTT